MAALEDAETFLVAWRRGPQVPAGDDARLWLYGVARRVLANHHRGAGCRDRLGDRLRDQLARQITGRDPADAVIETRAVRAAMERLGELDREVLRLTVWEQLEQSAQPVQVLGANSAMFGYGRRDLIVILPVQGKVFLEIRGGVGDRTAFLDVLGKLKHVDAAAWLAAMPATVVRPAQATKVAVEMLDDPSPSPTPRPNPTSKFEDRAQVRVKVIRW